MLSLQLRSYYVDKMKISHFGPSWGSLMWALMIINVTLVMVCNYWRWQCCGPGSGFWSAISDDLELLSDLQKSKDKWVASRSLKRQMISVEGMQAWAREENAYVRMHNAMEIFPFQTWFWERVFFLSSLGGLSHFVSHFCAGLHSLFSLRQSCPVLCCVVRTIHQMPENFSWETSSILPWVPAHCF